MVQSTYCRADVGYVDLNVRNTGVITDFFINTFKGKILVIVDCIYSIKLIEIIPFSFYYCTLQTDCGRAHLSYG